MTFSESPIPDRRRTNPNILAAGHHGDELTLKPNNSMPNFHGQLLHDSGSNTSSCDSSTPSSPALLMTSSGTVTSPSPAPASPRIQFQFPGKYLTVKSVMTQDLICHFKCPNEYCLCKSHIGVVHAFQFVAIAALCCSLM